MPRFRDLFFARLNVRKGWIGAGFVRLGQDLGVGKMLVGGLTCDFWAENSKKDKGKNSRVALRALLRPFDVLRAERGALGAPI